jgi:hypothetical protein
MLLLLKGMTLVRCVRTVGAVCAGSRPCRVFLSHTSEFRAWPPGRTPTPSSESRQVRWIPHDRILDLRMDRSMRMRVQHYLDARPEPYLG